ncbi:MAG: hypothetical protein FD159_2728 [Syntrophaceae bacterium]|nr:MAG: hypothetical protein FD159_2728 [Syntrophaceae bacterium]
MDMALEGFFVFNPAFTCPVRSDKSTKYLVFEVTIRETAICQKKKPLKKFRGAENKIRL